MIFFNCNNSYSLKYVYLLTITSFLNVLNQNNFGFLSFGKNFFFNTSTEGSESKFFLFLSLFSSFYISSSMFGASNACCFSIIFFYLLSLCQTFFYVYFLSLFSYSFIKYSPDSINKSIFLGYYSGGKGVYSFFSFFLVADFLVYFNFLNYGRNLSQFSFNIFVSFCNSLLIINSFMLYIG